MNLIVNAIFEMIYFLVAGITNFLAFLPDASLPSSMQSALANFGAVAYPFSMIVPFDTLGQCLFWLTSVFLGIAVFKFIKFGISLIPFL